jgi:hypothetical protein
MVRTTARGARVYATMCAIALKRDQTLTGCLDAADRAFFIGIIERIEANARQLLAAAQPARAAN